MKLPEVRIEAFEGPFDLLLELAGRQKVDLSEVSLADLTDDYLQYVQSHDVPVSLQGEWIVVAAALLLLKARQTASAEPDADDEDEVYLRARVQIYSLYRHQAEKLRERYGHRVLRGAGVRVVGKLPDLVFDAGVVQEGFLRVLNALPKPIRKRAHLMQYGKSLEECVVGIRKVLERRKSFVFQKELQARSRQEVAVSFLAVLELQRSAQAQLKQEAPWSDLVVRRV